MLTAIAFDQAYRDYSRALTGYARAVTGDSADAEDVAQDAWIEAWKGRNGVEAQGLWGWLRRVVKRVWWHRLNRAGQKRDGVIVPVEEAETVATDGGQEEEVQRTQIAEAAAYLKPAQAIAVNLALTGHDSGDMARLRGTTPQAATLAMRGAVAALRKRWRLE